MDVGAALIGSPESAVLVQPGEGPLDDPPEDAQSAAVWRSPFRNAGLDATRAKLPSSGLGVVSTVCVDTVRSLSWTAPFARYSRNRVDQWRQLRDIMGVRAGQDRCEGGPIRVCDQMMLAARGRPHSYVAV